MSTQEPRDERPEDPGRPLSEDEKALLKRLLAEPLEFPVEFRVWLKNFIETSGITLPRTSITGIGGGPGSIALSEFPAGVILPIAHGAAPAGTAPCNGSQLLRATYVDLFQAIGTTWGAGDGATTFNVPDLRDRALYGAGATVGLVATDGAALGSRGPRHHHHFSGTWRSGNDVENHTHAQPGGGRGVPDGGSFTSIDLSGGGWPSTYGISSGHKHDTTVDGDTTGGGVRDAPGYAGVLYVVTVGKTA